MILVVENLIPEDKNGPGHYWLFNINLRYHRFEVFDSSRKLKTSKRLDSVARTIVAAIRSLWDQHYPKQARSTEKFTLVDIDTPKQITSCDCGVFTLMNAILWNGTCLPNYGQSDITNIRKLLMYSMVTCKLNKVMWKDVLKVDKK